MMDTTRMFYTNRLILFALLGAFALAVYLWKRFKPEGLELSEFKYLSGTGKYLPEIPREGKYLLGVSVLPLYKRIQLRIWGRVYLEDRWNEKWKINVPYYLVNCPEHGLFEDYPHGRWLKCPKCGRKFYSSECWVGTGVHYPWHNREVTPWPKGAR